VSGALASIPADHWLRTTPMVVLDVESTGLDPEADRIVQIAMIQVDGGEITDEFVTLIDPTVPIPPESSAIHGIAAERLSAESATTFVMHAREIARRAARRVVVSYNAARFDLPIVRAELARCRIATGGRTPLDVLTWVRKLDRYVAGSGRHRLHETARRHGLTIDGTEHDAGTDARATWALMRRLVEEHPRVFRGDDDRSARAPAAARQHAGRCVRRMARRRDRDHARGPDHGRRAHRRPASRPRVDSNKTRLTLSETVLVSVPW